VHELRTPIGQLAWRSCIFISRIIWIMENHAMVEDRVVL
jgi:hypothetical protein